MLHSHSIDSTILVVLLSHCLAWVAICSHLFLVTYILDIVIVSYFHNSLQLMMHIHVQVIVRVCYR